MFYQTHSSLAREGLKLENGIDFNFPMHLHSSFEFILVTEGEMEIVVDGREYVLHEKDALLVFPNQLHELRTKKHSCHFLCIFSTGIVGFRPAGH
ncbi:MAG: cupin domain-containing protein [Clostridia bacterium]|nr:cupin domain-containing protein [Clostridia bacterium]